jgi:ankyrin repeat protein
MIAVINGNQPFVQTLVEYGADLKIKNEYGKNAYEMAVAMDRRVIIKLIET